MQSDFKIKRRIIYLFFFILLVVVIFLIRLNYLVFGLHDFITPQALAEWSREVPIEGKRGNIYDRNGNDPETWLDKNMGLWFDKICMDSLNKKP